MEEFLNHLEHHPALANTRLSGYQNAIFPIGIFQAAMNGVSLQAWQDNLTDGLVSQVAKVTLISLGHSIQRVGVFVPEAASKLS